MKNIFWKMKNKRKTNIKIKKLKKNSNENLERILEKKSYELICDKKSNYLTISESKIKSKSS